MPYRTLGLDEVARYLHLSRADVDLLVRSRDIPFEKAGGRILFRKVEIDNWASRRILGLKEDHLAEYHHNSSTGGERSGRAAPLLAERLQPEFIAPALAAKTKASVIREVAALAEKTGRVLDSDSLLESILAREHLCSTGMPGGFALLHPRAPDPYMFEAPLVVLARTIQQVPFGAPDGKATDLFFLLGCPTAGMHLHLLARLAVMAQTTTLLADLRSAPDSTRMFEAVIACEQLVLDRISARTRA